jgi:ATP-dependent Lhr-like helicase
MTVDDALRQDRAICRSLDRAWPAFFAGFGRLTEVQRRVIPAILEGSDVLVSAPTATGKTEAACAPLVELNVDRRSPWLILYVSPTRALVNDLAARLERPLGSLGLRVVRRTGDHKEPLDPVPHVLVTTPESMDSMLCRAHVPEGGHLLAFAVAVVLDEIHLLHGTARGEQLRWLIQRLRRLRSFARREGWTRDESLQIVALSATIPDSDAVRDAFLGAGAMAHRIPGQRGIERVDATGGDPRPEVALEAYIRGARQAEKIIVFCNARKRVDELALDLQSPLGRLGYKVLPHHGSLAQVEREATEEAIKLEPRTVVVSTSTFEIGIDIGDIDLVVLDGPAPDVPSLLQRIGRGNRRTDRTRVMACSGSILEELVHKAMLEAADAGDLGSPERGPQFSAVRQQVASYIAQKHRKRHRTRDELSGLLSDLLDKGLGSSLLEQMVRNGDLEEDGAGLRLGPLWREAFATGKIHSTIEDAGGANVIDADTGKPIAKGVDFRGGQGLKVAGRLLNVRNWDGRKLEVRRVSNEQMAQGDWGYKSRAWMRGAGQPQAVRRFLGIGPDEWAIVECEGDTIVFHFGGARRRTVLELILETVSGSAKATATDWALVLHGSQISKPDWLAGAGPGLLDIALHSRLDALEHSLARPYANKNLPLDMRIAEVKGWLQLDAELREIKAARWARVEDPDTSATLDLLWRELSR